jgi:antirestriction protein ArdC
MATINKDLMNEVTQKCITKMETCGAGWLRSWIGNSELPINCETNNPYTGINLFILLGAEMSSAKWGTYDAWKRIGKQVEQGQEHTKIVWFKIMKSKNETDENGKPRKFPMMRIYQVFNESQTVGYTAEVKTEGETFSHKLAEKWIKNTGALVEHKTSSAFYNPTVDKINMPPMETFFETDDATAEQNYWGTLFHELTHWTGHTSRLNRLIKNSSRQDYAKEELVAELGACFQSVHFGIEPVEVNADHTKYLNGWLQALKDDNSFIFKASAKANQAMTFLNKLQA